MNAVFWCRSEQRSPAFVHLHDFIKKQTSSLRCRDVEGAVPYTFVPTVCPPQNRFALCGVTLYKDIEKAVQSFYSDTALLFLLLLCAFISLSAPLSRLTPIEALPQTPQGTLSLDPASPLTPGLILRFISRYARCWGHNSGQLCSFLIPHSSFLIPHLLRHCLFHFLYKLPEHCKCFIDRLSCRHIYSCTLKQ